MHSTGDGGLG